MHISDENLQEWVLTPALSINYIIAQSLRFFVTVVRMFSVCVSMQAAACPRSFSPEAFTHLFELDNIWMLHFVQ
jgi:hypothetical protein